MNSVRLGINPHPKSLSLMVHRATLLKQVMIVSLNPSPPTPNPCTERGSQYGEVCGQIATSTKKCRPLNPHGEGF